MSLPKDEEVRAAIKNLVMTPDGLLLRRYLQLVLNEVPSIAGNDAGPLQAHNGRRSLARDLVSIMDERLAESATLDRSGDPSEPVIRQPAGKPVAAREPLSRRVKPYASPGRTS